MAEADAALEALMANPPAERHEFWRQASGCSTTVRRASRAGRARHSREVHNPEMRDMWAAFMQRSIDHTPRVIEVLRARGEIPVNMPAGELSTSLNLLNEAVMTALFAGKQPALADERVLDNLVHIWLTQIYGDAP